MFGGYLKYPHQWPRQFKYRSWVRRSEDGGLNWHHQGTIEALPDLGDEGFCEPNIAVLQDEETVYKKIRVLSKAPMQLLLILIRSDDYRADIQSVFYNDHGIQLEYYEVEAAASALA